MKKQLLFLTIFFTQLSFAGVVPVGDSNFQKEVLESSGPVIVKSFTPFCGECQDMAPHFSRASNQTKDAKFVELNTIQNPKIRNRFSIALVPTTIIFKDGKEVYRHVGLLSYSALVSLAKKYK